MTAGRKGRAAASPRRKLVLPIVILGILLLVAYALVPTNGARLEAAQPPTVATPSGTKSFPGAVGWGASSVGGRGGRIIYVTTLADSGTGSYRACVTATGPRICVFRVAGVIRFTTTPPIIEEPYLTIAGQTAPGSGIVLAHAGAPAGRTPLVIKNTHDVVVRNIRIRADLPGGSRGSEDSITIEHATRVLVDHVSASWARDELINGYADNDYITVSNSIFAWGTPPHDKCALLASDPVDAQHFSFINNLCAHNGDRMPDVNFPPKSCLEVVDNVFYNAQSRFAEVWELFGGTPVSFVGNSFIGGPNTTNLTVGIARDTSTSKGGAAIIYAWDNRFAGAFQDMNQEAEQALVNKPPCALTINPLSAANAYTLVLQKSGAFPRDAIDNQAVYDVEHGSGRIGQPAPVMPAQTAGQPYPDADKDGMDDNWEVSVGANPKVPDAWADANKNGVPNFEEFLAYRNKVLGL
ncbi:pectate lyase [Novosphingobium sp. BL-8H]|uniref:pectate lyase family protein n=1 Tax=Novosphingobium sp. BL-8H TaxID=3127640 RepID=UPI0037566A06